MVHSAPAHAQGLIPNQCQQAWTRLIIIFFGVIYISWHGELLPEYQSLCWSAVVIYIAWQFYTLIDIPRRPLSTSRFLISPILDALLIAIGIMLDSGQGSGIFLCYFVMIMSNGVRFGNPMLLYSQALAVLSYLFTCSFTYLHPQLDLDIPLLFLHVLSLLLLPYYIYIISKHAKASFAAKEQAQNMSFDALSRSPAPIFTFQINHKEAPRITYANAAIQQVYRNDISSLIGEQVDIIALMEDGNEVIKACQASFNELNNKPIPFYIRGRNTHDQILKIMGQTSSLSLQGHKVGICFLVDITQNETMHSDMEKNMHDGHVSTLISGIAHDFRNILTSIIGSAEVMQFRIQDQSIIDQLGLIINAGERGSDMVSKLLSQNTANETTRSSNNQTIEQSLTSMVNLLRIQLPAHIQLQLDIEEQLPEVHINLTQLEQILMNLIKNSTESMQNSGCINIQLRTNPHHKFAKKFLPALTICVQDEGKGIAPKDLDKVTKAFWTSRSNEGGTGLGLAMVQRIVHNNSGELDIQSTLEKGTQINITFPAISNEQAFSDTEVQPDSATEKTMESSDNMIPWHILLVDDNPVVLGIHQHLLERMGHKVTTAESAESALAFYQSSLKGKIQKIDLLATDFRMDGMDGIDLSKYIRQHDAHLAILMITAYGDAEKFQQNKNMHVDVLHKPTSYKKLESLIIKLQRR
ncbi:MAG: response regulator [Mariprofundaceae bacterium]|nr:response regulator [Mariprofundaceae bacterium]